MNAMFTFIIFVNCYSNLSYINTKEVIFYLCIISRGTEEKEEEESLRLVFLIIGWCASCINLASDKSSGRTQLQLR
jgi:hypothetical protein